MRNTFQIPNRRLAFTLVELMVSMAILVLLITVVVQIVDGAQKTTGASKARLECDAEARTIFDRMALDISRMPNRRDLDYLFDLAGGASTTGANGSDAFFFYSEAPAAYTGTANTEDSVSLVGYRINNDYKLERYSQGLAWTPVGATKGVIFLTYAPPTGTLTYPTPTPTPEVDSTITGGFGSLSAAPSDDNYHVIGGGVFRMEVTFLLKPNPTNNLAAIYSNFPYDDRITGHTDQFRYVLGLSDVQAIIVTLAIIDAGGRKMLTTSQLQSMASSLPRVQNSGAAGISPNSLPGEKWETTIDDGSLSAPKSVASRVRVYQRMFLLTSNSN